MAFHSKEFGSRLKSAIKSAGISQKELAGRLGIKANSLTNFINGRVPDGMMLLRLADELGVTARWLLTGHKKSPPPDLEALARLMSCWKDWSEGYKKCYGQRDESSERGRSKRGKRGEWDRGFFEFPERGVALVDLDEIGEEDVRYVRKLIDILHEEDADVKKALKTIIDIAAGKGARKG
ncbi:MAG TPA: XRE family transcriptional regulator [Deltaproteobacteria bacterium]|nr:XRE family transcriptional regulator [Deltaproteobacteria bacterium]